MPTVSHNIAIYINQAWEGQSSNFGPKVSRHANQALLFEFSSSLLVEEAKLRVARWECQTRLVRRSLYRSDKYLIYDYLINGSFVMTYSTRLPCSYFLLLPYLFFGHNAVSIVYIVYLH